MKTKLYNCIINFKAAQSTRTMQTTRSTVHITEKMYDILQRTNVDERLKAGKMIKSVFDAVLTHTIKTQKRINASITEGNSTNKSNSNSKKLRKQKTGDPATSPVSEKVKNDDSNDLNLPKSTTQTTTSTPKSALRKSSQPHNKKLEESKNKNDNGDNDRHNNHPKFTPPPPTRHHQQRDERIPPGHTYAGVNFDPMYRKSGQQTPERRVNHNPNNRHKSRYNDSNNYSIPPPIRHSSPRRRSGHHHRQRSRSRSPVRENRYSSSSSSKKYRHR